MKKIIKKIKSNSLFTFILGGLIFGSIGIYGANKYQSNTIEYSPTDENWEVSNVSDALNELYTSYNELAVNNKSNFTITFTLSVVTQYTSNWSSSSARYDSSAVTNTIKTTIKYIDGKITSSNTTVNGDSMIYDESHSAIGYARSKVTITGIDISFD